MRKDVFTELNALRFILVLGINAVPALGWFMEGWSAGTALAIYWFENVLASLFVTGRILLHRRFVPCQGHFRYRARAQAKRSGKPGTFLAAFLVPSLIFSVAHGIFLVVIIFVLTQNGHGRELGLNFHNILQGCGLVSFMLVVDFLADLPGLRTKPFLWIEARGMGNLGRVVLVHLSIVLGMCAVAMTGATRAFFAVFAGLKILADLSGAFPQWNPGKPPPWLCRIMDRLPNAYPGLTFEQFWAKDKQDEADREAANEKPMLPPGKAGVA